MIDMILCFMTAYYSHDYTLIKNRKAIAYHYLKTWFVLDFIAIFPFDLLFPARNVESVTRITRLYRIMRIFRITKLMKLSTVFRNQKGGCSRFFNSNQVCERLTLFILFFFLLGHVLACLWIM